MEDAEAFQSVCGKSGAEKKIGMKPHPFLTLCGTARYAERAKATEKVTEKVTERVTEKVTEKVTERVAEKQDDAEEQGEFRSNVS